MHAIKTELLSKSVSQLCFCMGEPIRKHTRRKLADYHFRQRTRELVFQTQLSVKDLQPNVIKVHKFAVYRVAMTTTILFAIQCPQQLIYLS